MNERIQKLQLQIKELLEWKESNAIQQIPSNPSINTTKVMQDGLLVTTGKSTLVIPTFDILLEVNIGDEITYLPAKLNQ